MEISNRDKKLLVYLLAVGIIAGTYFFAARPFMEKQESLSSEIDDLNMKINHYNEIYQNRENYERQVEEAEAKYEELLSRFSGDIKQDNSIMLIKDIEKATNVWISKIVFTDSVSVENTQSAEIEVRDDDTVVISDSSETAQETETNSSSELKQDLTLEFSGNYTDFKKLIDYVKNYDKRLYISNMSSMYNVDSDRVTGTLTLSQFALMGAGIEDSEFDLSNVKLGTSNIFTTLKPASMGLEFDVQTLIDDENSESEEASESEENASEESNDESGEELGSEEDNGTQNTDE